MNAIFLGDGSVQLIDTSNLLETIQLTGANADAIYRICSHGNVVYSASRDGAIRKYQMNILHHYLGAKGKKGNVVL